MKQLSNWLSALLVFLWFEFMWVFHIDHNADILPIRFSMADAFYMVFVTYVFIIVNEWVRNKLRNM